MKKYLVPIMLIGVVLLMGATTQIGRALRTDSFGWELGGETATAYTSPAVNERDYTNFVANHADAVTFTIDPYRWNTLEARFIVDDDADDTVFDVFASRGQDFFARMCTLTLVGGTASAPGTSTDANSAVFVDTITVTNSEWFSTITTVSGTNVQAKIMWDMNGYDTWSFVGTTVDDTTKVQITGH
jgi:hypothetical protein